MWVPIWYNMLNGNDIGILLLTWLFEFAGIFCLCEFKLF